MLLEVIESMKESINTTLGCSNLAIQAGHTQSQKTVDARKESFMEKFFLATLWAKLLIITINFGYKTKVFSETWMVCSYSEAQTSCTYMFTTP